MPEPLEQFDPQATCPKCGSEEISAAWHGHPLLAPGSPCWSASLEEGVQAEHVCRRCARCSYSWCEAPIEPYRILARVSLPFAEWAARYLAGHPWGHDILHGQKFVYVHIPAGHVRRMLEDAYRAGAGEPLAGADPDAEGARDVDPQDR